MEWKVFKPEDAEGFKSAVSHASKFLEKHEELNNLMLGLLHHICNSKSIAEGAKELSVIGLGYVEKEGEAIACVLLSASHPMPIALPLSKDLVPYLVEELIKIDYRVLGVNSSSEIASYFAQLWKEKTNVQMEREATIRLYSLKEVTLDANAQNVEGELIQCTMNDFDLIKSWMKLFEVQTGRKVHPNEDGFNSLIKSRLESGLFYLWKVKGKPVSMCAYTMITPRSARIFAVLTPDSERRKGYATNAVASLVNYLLHEIKVVFCMLFADLANPTSNSIYMKIGFKPVADFDELHVINH